MFTSVKTSSYAYPDGTNISGLTDLQDIVQTVEPFSAQVFNETMLQVSARFDNSQVQSAYLIQTLGIYAQVGSGSPVLFAVVQADTPDQMPAQSAVSPSAFIYNIQTTVQQATSLTVSVNPAGTATVQDILDLKNTKVDINRGNISNTVTDVTEPDEDDDYPTIQTSGGVTSAILGGLLRWTKSLKDKKVDSNAGDISATSVVSFTESSAQYPVPSAGDSVKVIAGKIIKFFQDIRSTAIGACYIGQLVSNNTTNNPNLPASAAAVYQEAQLRAQQFAQLNSDKLQPITLSSAGITYDENYVDPSGTTISIYKMGRLVIITGSLRFTGESFSNNVLIRNLPVACWQTRFGLTSYVPDASQVFGVLGGDSINMSGSPVSSREYRFCFATFSNS